MAKRFEPDRPASRRCGKSLVLGGPLVLAFAGLQVFPARSSGIPIEVIGTNPPERLNVDAPPKVAAILRRSCFDCHSNETRWPFYTRIAPASWLMAYDVYNAREQVNFSTWGDEGADERQDDKRDCWDQIEANHMPRWYYVYPFHLRARLSNSDKAALKSWLLSIYRARPPAEME
jgi:hypothetical protein